MQKNLKLSNQGYQMKYLATLIQVEDDLEEDVMLDIMGIRIYGFANVVPFQIFIGHKYYIEITPMIFEDYDVNDVPFDSTTYIRRIDNTLSYEIQVRLEDGIINVGLFEFYDEVLQRDFSFLNGRIVNWKIDRLDIEFVSASNI